MLGYATFAIVYQSSKYKIIYNLDTPLCRCVQIILSPNYRRKYSLARKPELEYLRNLLDYKGQICMSVISIIILTFVGSWSSSHGAVVTINEWTFCTNLWCWIERECRILLNYTPPAKIWNIWKAQSKHLYLSIWLIGNGWAPTTNKYCDLVKISCVAW